MDNPPDQYPIENSTKDHSARVDIDRVVDQIRVVNDLPHRIPVDREEIAMLRAFLGDDIRAIMQDEE